MNKLTYKEILDILKINLSVEEFAHYNDTSNMFNLGEMKEVSQYGGSGKGENWYAVKYFKDHDIYIRVNGFYSSYLGVSFDSWDECVFEVRPENKTITVYE